MLLGRWIMAMTLPRLVVGVLCMSGSSIHVAWGESATLAAMGLVFAPLTTLALAAAQTGHGGVEGVSLVLVAVGAWADFFMIGHGRAAWVATVRRRAT